MTSNFNDSDLYQYPPFNPHRADPIWNLDSDYLIPVVSSVGNGPKGDKGDPLVFDDLTDEQMQKVLQEANYLGNECINAEFRTVGSSTTAIEIPIEDYDKFDMLFVDIEGLDLHEGVDYTIVSDNIVLTNPITHPDTKVHFRAIRYTTIDGNKRILNVMGQKDYTTAEVMKLDEDLQPGDICHTLGWAAKGDKGAAWYIIADDAVANDTDILALDNGYFALLQPEDESVNPEQLGALDYTVTDWAGVNQSYNKRTVVREGTSCYTARQDVPTGIQITNEEYWVKWNNNDSLILTVQENTLTIQEHTLAIQENTLAIQENTDELYRRCLVFDTVADMQAAEDLYIGAICHTNGFYSPGDGGATWYEVSDTASSERTSINLGNNLYAIDMANLQDIVVWFGDSYTQAASLDSQQNQRFSTLVSNKLGMVEKNYAVGGCGFTTGTVPYAQQVTNAINDDTYDKNRVKIVVVSGGLNDAGANPSYTFDQITLAVQPVFDQIANAFPNAKIFFIPLMFYAAIPNRIYLHWYAGMQWALETREVHIIKYAYQWLCGFFGLILSDGIHPNVTGHARIAHYVWQGLHGGNTKRTDSYVSLIPDQDYISTGFCNIALIDGVVHLDAEFTVENEIPVSGYPFSLSAGTNNVQVFIGNEVRYTPIISKSTGDVATTAYYAMNVGSSSFTVTFRNSLALPPGNYQIHDSWPFATHMVHPTNGAGI